MRTIASSFDFHNHLSFTFNEDVSTSLSVDDLIVQPQPSGAAVSPVSVSWDAAGDVATFTFAGDFQDGNYRATLSAGKRSRRSIGSTTA